MNVFKTNGGTDENQAKALLKEVVAKNISKYIVVQKQMVVLVTEKPVRTKCTKKKKCTLCVLEAMSRDMAIYQDTAREMCKSYELMFGSRIDVAALTRECEENIFNDSQNEEVILPENAPKEVKDIADMFTEAMKKSGMKAKMRVIDMSGTNYGLKQEDYSDFPSYAMAVDAARQAAESIKTGEKSAEDVLTESMLKKAEEIHPEDQAKSKLN